MGMEQAGHECVGYVEWDKFARKSYEAIYDVENEWSAKDIRTVRASEIPQAECWCFGFPCQDISVAGKQKGITKGNRSSLFFTVTRLIRGIEEKDRPSYLFIENVKNLLGINRGFDFARVLIELDEIGYDVEWDVIDSANLVPQHRERVYIIGHLRGRSTRKVFPFAREGQQASKPIQIAKRNVDRHSSEGNSVLSGKGVSNTITARSYKDPVRVAVKQVGNLMETNSFGGNPQVGRVYDPSGISPTLNTMQGGGREPKVAIPVLTPDRINKRQNGRRFKENGDPEFTLTGQDRHGVYDEMRIRKITPKECWRLQGFPDWAFDKAEQVNSNSQLYKQAGNSVTVPVIKAIAERMKVED